MKRTSKSHYNKNLITHARNLRNDSTLGEIILWNEVLSNTKMYGYQFNRQFSISNYIVDFISRKLKLIIEIDGYSHNFKYEQDKTRDKYLNQLGYNVLRFTENEVKKDIDNVIMTIESYILNFEKSQSPSPPSPRSNKGKISFHILLCLAILLTSCEDWLDINKDPNNPDEANEELTLAAGISSVAYVYGGRYQVLGALWSQHWTQSLGASQYTGLDSYNISSSTYDLRQFGELYTGALKNFEYIRNLSQENGNWNYYLMATVIQSYTYQILTDLYDQIPFSEALKGDEGLITPVYEEGQNVYDSLIARIDFALSTDYENEDLEDVGSEDILFEGKTDRWLEFANTLKLKIYLRQLHSRPGIAEQGIESLYNDQDVKFLTTSAAMTQFTNETGRRNPLYETEIVFLGNNPNLILSNTLLSFMNDKGDLERLDALFDFPENGGGHKGLDQGNYNDPDEPKGTNSASYSKPYLSPYAPIYLMSAAESYFLQAEAIIRYGVKPYTEAKEMYEKGIDWSFQRLGYSDGEEYYGPGDVYEFPAEGSPLESFIESIIVQKWIALANIQSLETFFEHNRTHYPKESPYPADHGDYVPGEFTISVNNVTSSRFPKRLIYPESEYSGNPNTPEKMEVHDNIWWDKKIDTE